MRIFYPDTIVKKFNDVTTDYLKENSILGVILDIDNTLVTYEQPEPTREVLEWINKLNIEGIKICILSNGKKERVEKFNKYVKLPAVYKALKPSNKGFLTAMKIMELSPGNIAILGDQIFTDILGGNRMKMHTVFVEPISNHESILIKFKRFFEKFVLCHYYKNIPKMRNSK